MNDGRANTEELITLAEQSIKAGKPRLAQAAIDKITEDNSARRISVEMQLITLSGNPAAAVELAKNPSPTFPILMRKRSFLRQQICF